MGNAKSCIIGNTRVTVCARRLWDVWEDVTDRVDPFASAELEAGRLPKVVDDWLNQQILDGFTVDQIRAKLELSPEAKEEVNLCLTLVIRLPRKRLN